MENVIQSPGKTEKKSKGKAFRPTKAIIYGLIIAVVLASFVSMIESVIFSILMAPELGPKSSSVEALANSNIFLIINIIIYSLMMYYAGTIVRKHAQSRESKFGAIVSVITFIIYILLFWVSNTFSEFPEWYNISVLLTIVVALNLGAKRRV